MGFVKKQGRIHGSISCVQVGRGSIVVGQGQSLKSDLLSALNTWKSEVILDGRTDGPTDRQENDYLEKSIWKKNDVHENVKFLFD